MKTKKFLTGLFLLVVLPVALAVFITAYYGDAWEKSVRAMLYTVTRDSIPDYAVEFTDEAGVPYVFYPEQNGVTAGKQYNPTIVCNYALGYYNDIVSKGDSGAVKKFDNCVRWLVLNISHKDDHALFVFNWQQPWYDSVGTPYTSGMTSGLAIEVFTNAYLLHNNPQYLQNAAKLLRGFYQPIYKGGFTYKETFGWWYEELADTTMRSPYILDGHIFSILGVHKYWQVTKADSAQFIFLQGMNALKHYLPVFDAGNGNIYYDKYRKQADKKYHRIITTQLKKLVTITNDPLIIHYYKKWNEPLERLYALRVLEEKNRSGIILILLVTMGMASILFSINTLYKRW